MHFGDHVEALGDTLGGLGDAFGVLWELLGTRWWLLGTLAELFRSCLGTLCNPCENTVKTTVFEGFKGGQGALRAHFWGSWGYFDGSWEHF